MEQQIDMETGEILAQTSALIIREPFAITPLGLDVTGAPTIDDWITFGAKIYGIRSALQWSIGDWILYGESRVDWGDKYEQALSMFDYAYDYLRQMASIARQFPRETRHTNVSWSHHKVVSPLTEPLRDQLLIEAAALHLTRDELSDRVKALQSSDDDDTDDEPTETVIMDAVQVQLSGARLALGIIDFLTKDQSAIASYREAMSVPGEYRLTLVRVGK